jgi:TolA-binding protein
VNVKKDWYCTGLALSMMVVGCNKPAERPPQQTNTGLPVPGSATQALQSIRGQFERGKDQVISTTEQKLKDFDVRIDELGRKAEGLAVDAKAEANKALEVLREKRAQLQPRIEELKKSTQQTWEDTKAGLETAMTELDKAYQNARSKLGL